MKKKKVIKRRKFIGDVSASAAAFTIVPRHVLGKGKIPPSDKVLVANIGCGTQGLREMPDMLENDAIQVVAICDVNKYTTDYLDWSPNGILNGIRNTLGDKQWGKYIKGIPGGRDIGKEYVDDYYKKKTGAANYNGCASYEDYRELLEKETDLDAVKIMTPDHHHGCIAMAAMKKGRHVITHKPISNRLHEGLKVIEATKTYDVRSHLMAWEDKPNYRLIKQWIEDGVIGQLTEIHNWSVRPVWPQFTTIPKEQPPIPDGFNWQLWLGPEKDRPYHPNYTHNVFRGWYDFGGGSIADMGHYSLFPLFRTFNINQAPVSAKAYGSTTRTSINGVCRNVNNMAAFPGSCMVKFNFGAQGNLGPFDLYWYDGGMKPFAPEELEVDGRDISIEGMLFVGTEGKILAGFEGENPEIIPKSKMVAYSGTKSVENPTPERRSDTWTRAILTGEESPGSFRYAGPVHETLNLGAVA
ncbi:MAG: Gfo/Idh/MocA family oxidoreductase, partial [Saprospiraceae bacterium]|nr:Gfo/Idh/MocA family oxidoreductase [Saprospiraceae bacterium]